ncbi:MULTISPECIES: lipid A deacylase LpxR family protein [Bizionia]|uniref:Lipid A deacylase LpxR family protein n=1 Tax=Bizionia algoritergicola TaxID=291187 RepID=A0A5D0QS77_9FLAO|nr:MULTISPECIES: lipid A deacylase LpxR family protein [Bizionia]OBX21138.1 hypothetical protein BAA08_13875 [Bizionia sp. APA-3]TYB71726.1 lipid A deacylase LpxR family protein [Bizionia algoritergicola]
MIKFSLLTLVLLLHVSVFAQETKTYNNEIEIVTDNDFFVIYNTSDRNYTYGISGRYRWKTNNTNYLGSLFKEKQGHSYMAGINIEAYTPNYLDDDTKDDEIIERPYAGWSYAEFQTNYIFNKSYFRFGLEMGVLGKASQAGVIQNYFHEHISRDEPIDWSDQIPNQFGLNFTGSYAHEIYSTGFLDTFASVDASLGNIHTYVWPKLNFRLGKLNNINASVGSKNGLFSNNEHAEWFFDYGVGYKISFYNATIQGNIFNTNLAKPETQINHYIFTSHAGVQYSFKRFAATFSMQFNTGEFDRTKNHSFGSLKILYRF